MANIDDFKANLIGGGARANQFRVTITPPSGIAIGLDVRRASFLVTASILPASTLGEIAVPFRGRNIYVSGDRPAPDVWSTTFYNDTDFMVRNAMELWHNGINDFANNTGVINPSDYQTDLFVEQLEAINPMHLYSCSISCSQAYEFLVFQIHYLLILLNLF